MRGVGTRSVLEMLGISGAFQVNLSRQPAPGASFLASRAPLARRGCVQRWVKELHYETDSTIVE